MKSEILSESRGQVAVLYTLIGAILIGAVALGADVAVMYVNWQQAQKVADAAALAGANYLAGYDFSGTPATGCTTEPDSASKAACTYAVDNGIAVSDLTITEPNGGADIQVVVQQSNNPYFFAKALGMSTYSVSATAGAAAGGPIGTVTQGLFPVGLQCTTPCSLSSLDPVNPCHSDRSSSAVWRPATGSFSMPGAEIPDWPMRWKTECRGHIRSAALYNPNRVTKAIRRL